MPISQQGSVNTTSLIVPDLYVQIVPPQNLVLNGVPTNILGVVGTASWGPVDEPAIVATMADYAQQFGSIVPRKYDMGTQVATAVQQGAQNFRCVRVTDGTDTAAYTAVPGTNASFTAIYTGSLGNNITRDTRRRDPTQHLDAVGPSCRVCARDLRRTRRKWCGFLDGSGRRGQFGLGAAARTIPPCHSQRGRDDGIAGTVLADLRCVERWVGRGDTGRQRSIGWHRHRRRGAECMRCGDRAVVSRCLRIAMIPRLGPPRRASDWTRGYT